jgi:hypothetical protein
MAKGWIVPVVLSGGASEAAFAPSDIAGYSRDWNFADATKLYTDVAHTTSVTADGNTIGAIVDGVGGTVYLVASGDDTTRPTYKTNIQNGLSVGRFDGSNDYIGHATAITADASQTIFVVLKKSSAATNTNHHALSVAAGAQFYTNTDHGASGGLNYFSNEASGIVAMTNTPTDWNIVALKYTSAASVSIYFNGGAPNTFDPSDGYATSTALFLASNVAGAQLGDFDYGRVVVYSAALSNTDLDLLFSYLGTLWDITVTAVS